MELSDVAKICFLVSIVATGIYHWKRRRTAQAPPPLGRLRDLRSAWEALSSRGYEQSFVVFLVPEEHDTEPHGEVEPSPNIQFSVEGGVVGLDWVLISPANVKKEADFLRIARDRGQTVRRLRQNDVSYLRVEDGDVVELGRHVLAELFAVDSDYPLGLVVDGIDWLPEPA